MRFPILICVAAFLAGCGERGDTRWRLYRSSFAEARAEVATFYKPGEREEFNRYNCFMVQEQISKMGDYRYWCEKVPKGQR